MTMKKRGLYDRKNIIKYIIYVASVTTACYGFWGCLFPDLTLVKGTYQVVNGEEAEDMEQLYADILEEKVTVTYCSKLWEIIKNRCGFECDE